MKAVIEKQNDVYAIKIYGSDGLSDVWIVDEIINSVQKRPEVRWLRIFPWVQIPEYAHEGDSGFDLCSAFTEEIMPGERKAIRTGLKVELPEGYELQIRPRSSLSLNSPFIIPNSPGTIDNGYRGEINVILWNTGNEVYRIEQGDRIAQGVIQKVPEVRHIEVMELTTTDRGENGLGSTGVHR
jgi:dUTP pyrophosphatase